MAASDQLADTGGYKADTIFMNFDFFWDTDAHYRRLPWTDVFLMSNCRICVIEFGCKDGAFPAYCATKKGKLLQKSNKMRIRKFGCVAVR